MDTPTLPPPETHRFPIRTVFIASLAVVVFLALGWDSRKSSWELVSAGNAVYRLNKRSGEVSQITDTSDNGTLVLREIKPGKENIAKPVDTQKNRVKVWPDLHNMQWGELKFQMKTDWKNSDLFYIFQVGIKGDQMEKAQPNSQLVVRFYDAEGFEVLTFRVQLDEMSKGFDETGKVVSLTANRCFQNQRIDMDSYDALKTWSVGLEELRERR